MAPDNIILERIKRIIMGDTQISGPDSEAEEKYAREGGDELPPASARANEAIKNLLKSRDQEYSLRGDFKYNDED